MSKRHRPEVPVERAPKRARRWATHRERQLVRAGLAAAIVDPEEVVLHDPKHHGPRVVAASEPRRRRPRHWKVKEWKRRTARRRLRAAMAREVAL
ncbi:MAG TPA: hypothetical protein VFP54_09655 [Acidimicrobiales bacterium]|nr:hypothetical protein [Acidimicrobiales bacterium]